MRILVEPLRVEGLPASARRAPVVPPTPSRAHPRPACRLRPPQAVRQNRLALLRDVAALPAGILDLAELPGF